MKPLQLFAVSLSVFLSVQANAQDQHLTVAQTPAQIKSYVSTNFPNNKMLTVKKDKELSGVDYEVKLDGDIELVFDKNFVIKDIESKTALPAQVVPQKIREAVSEKYPHNAITSWEKNRRNQKVELDNDVELYFDLNGKFIKADN